MKRISLVGLVVLLVAVVIGLATGVAFYWHYIGEMLERDVKANIVAAANETADSFSRALEADQRVVDTIAITAQTNYPWDRQKKLARFLQLQVKYNEFVNLGILPIKGESILARPDKLDESWQEEFLMRGLSENTFVSSRQTDPTTQRNVFVQGASLHDNKEPIGTLFALIPTERYRAQLTLASLGENGMAIVIARNGDVQAAGWPFEGDNVFDLLSRAQFEAGQSLSTVRGQISEGKTMFVRYHLNGQNRLLYGMALPANEWYLLAVLPTDFIQAQTQRVTWVSFALFLFLFMLFGALGLYIFILRSYSNRQLFKTAFIDTLTGTDNLHRMTLLFHKRWRGLDEKAALIIFDILKFKVINDMLGYERGNLILQRAAQLFKENLKPNEFVCRNFADKFVLLLEFDSRRELRSRLMKLLALIRRDCTSVDSCVMVDGAFGVYEVNENIPFYIALDRAHLALENAKHSTKEPIQFYDEKDRHRILQERQLENAMEQALTDGSFTLMLQPKFNFQTGKMEGAEALVRWNQNERGLIRPDDFIPLFERNGFILKLDMFILEQAVKFLAKWGRDGKLQVPIAVNFSRLHLNDSRYIPQMTHIVDGYSVAHHLIEVELTESVILNNRELAQNVVRGLHNKGFSVAMDDFGSGYSSLNVLKSLQFDTIKLDKEFISGCEHQNSTARKVVQGAVEMIKAIGAQVVAEGVETNTQAEFLRRVGCDLAQGYYFSRPLSVEEFEKLLTQEK